MLAKLVELQLMAAFTGFEGNLLDTTPLKKKTTHGGDDLTISELSATPNIHWMGAPPETPPSREWDGPDTSQTYEDASIAAESFVGTESSHLASQSNAEDPESLHEANDTDWREQELERIANRLRVVNQTLLKFNDGLRASIPIIKRMQTAISTVDHLSKTYNDIMIQTEHTAKVLEDPTWPGADEELRRLQQRREEKAARKREEERQRKLALQREQEEQLKREREKLQKEEKQKLSRESVGRGLTGRGRARGAPTRANPIVATGRGRGSIRPSSIARPTSLGSRSEALSSIRSSISTTKSRLS